MQVSFFMLQGRETGPTSLRPQPKRLSQTSGTIVNKISRLEVFHVCKRSLTFQRTRAHSSFTEGAIKIHDHVAGIFESAVEPHEVAGLFPAHSVVM